MIAHGTVMRRTRNPAAMRLLSAITLGAIAPLLAISGCATGTATANGTAAASGTPARAVPFALPFIDDDYDRALAEARSRGVPLFVDAWAPW